VICQTNLTAKECSGHTLVLDHHAGRQRACVYSFLGARCVADAGLGATGMAIGDNPNDGPCPFPDSSWLGAGGSDVKLPTTTYRSKER